MADLEAVLADVSYLMAMEKSKCTPAARASKKIVLPDPSWNNVASIERSSEPTWMEFLNKKAILPSVRQPAQAQKLNWTIPPC
ncbi:hypothetical protein TKK_0014204 [Trichogramma kaykai]